MIIRYLDPQAQGIGAWQDFGFWVQGLGFRGSRGLGL